VKETYAPGNQCWSFVISAKLVFFVQNDAGDFVLQE
jgi:hypothetical protein